MRLRYTIITLAVVCAASLAQAAMTNQGDFSINGLKPATNSYTGNGITFIPAGTDSIAQNTLVINWREKDTVDTTKYNQVFQRITIPAAGGTPTVLATATIRWDMLYDGVNKFDASGSRPNELAFDAASKKIVTVSSPSDGGSRFFWFDLFSSNTTVAQGQLGYSAKNGDNAAGPMSKAIVATPDGKYTNFYPLGTNWVKASVDISAGNNAAITKTPIAKTSFTGWYPNTSVYPYDLNGYGCEGGVAYGDSLLVIRDYRNGTGGPLESHLYQVGNAFDAAAINNYTDLGNMTPAGTTYASLVAFGVTVGGSTGYVRYGFNNDGGSQNRILMVDLPPVPEPATLALVAFGACGLLLRRRRA